VVRQTGDVKLSALRLGRSSCVKPEKSMPVGDDAWDFGTTNRDELSFKEMGKSVMRGNSSTDVAVVGSGPYGRFLDPALRLGVARIKGTSAPRLSRSFESSVRGLYFAGLSAAPTFEPLMRFVCGADFTARTIRRARAHS